MAPERINMSVISSHEHRVGVDAERLGVVGVERVLGVDERRDPARLLRVGHGVQRHRGLAAALRAVHLHHPAAGQAADAEGDVQRDGAGGDHRGLDDGPLPQPHHRTLAELLVDLGEREIQRPCPVRACRHACHP
ncbi:hypothetical protein GCM10010124_20120 [Pilimelia terevasa]|uniref:Uncharacterized protein n=1 Tax=Pilimelia terevasa TaxID=53372 RepID=A0A8J3FJ28_9ACTN|nr:hypothetical protein GCM10010124_20120 [Pilimelia terevasa]